MMYLEQTGFILHCLHNFFFKKGESLCSVFPKMLICWQMSKCKSWNQMRIWVIHSFWLEREFALWILVFFKLEGGGVFFRRFAGTWRRTGVSMSGQPNSGRKDGTTLHLLDLSSPKQGFSCGFREAANTSGWRQRLMRTREEGSPRWDRRRATRVCLQWAPIKRWPGQAPAASQLAKRGTKSPIGAIAVHREETASLLYCCPHPDFALSLARSWHAREHLSYNLPFLLLRARFLVLDNA